MFCVQEGPRVLLSFTVSLRIPSSKAVDLMASNFWSSSFNEAKRTERDEF